MAFMAHVFIATILVCITVTKQQREFKRENLFGRRANSIFFTSSTNHVSSTNACDNLKECPTHQSRYRQMNGICNNAVDSTSGAANFTLKRLLKADYGDGKSTLRLSQAKIDLPSARVLANLLSDDTQTVSKLHTHMMPWWGQFIAHDLIDTPKEPRDDGAKYNCNCESPDLRGCINIKVSKTDQQFLKAAKKCIQVIRSEATTCPTEMRQQVNRLTSFMDAGNVYSDNVDYFHNLLNPFSPIGEMKTGDYESRGTNLPTSLQTAQDFRGKTSCDLNFRKPSTMPCFAAGDRRANENTGLTAIHTIFVRLHNKITRRLRVLNRHWSKDRIIQETKLITSAMQQIITFREFLPTVIGPTWMTRLKLGLSEKGYWFGYKSYINSAISAAFSTAAFRFGHTSIGSLMHRMMAHWHGAQGRPITIRESFFNGEPIVNKTGGGIDAIIRGLLVDKSKETSFNMNPHFRNFLFTHKGILGDDLLAINTQRGRDHGLPGYNHYRVLCGMERAMSFNQLSDISPLLRQKLKQAYRHVDDIDLYIGGLMEAVVDGGAVGPTFACIIAYQFRDIRNGDRYWHENYGSMASFTADQLEALRGYSFAKLLCDTSLDMVSLQKYPMLLPTLPGNERVLCSTLPEFNLIPWREQKTFSKDFDLPRESMTILCLWKNGGNVPCR